MLTAKPLLKAYFPELADLAQPLGGIIAARRDLLQRLRFENDYGVDIGLLIDAVRERARIVEVDIGELRHESQSLEALGEMAMQVTRTIIERAAEWGRLRLSFVRESGERERLARLRQGHALKRMQNVERLALIDMDGTLLNGRFVIELARATGREEALQPLLDNAILSPVQRTRRIAALFAGVPRHVFEKVARNIPLMPGAVETVVGLRKAGYRVAIVTDSYHSAAETVRRRVFADFVVAHLMKFRREKATGRVTFAPAMREPARCPSTGSASSTCSTTCARSCTSRLTACWPWVTARTTSACCAARATPWPSSPNAPPCGTPRSTPSKTTCAAS